MSEPKKRDGEWLMWVAIGITLILVYGVAYRATVIPWECSTTYADPTAPHKYVKTTATIPLYPGHNPFGVHEGAASILEWLFFPAHHFDRMLRTDVWKKQCTKKSSTPF